MSTFVFDCPSCSAKNSTFDIAGFSPKPQLKSSAILDIFAICRACKNSCSISGIFTQDESRHIYSLNRDSDDHKSGFNYIASKLNKDSDCRGLFRNLYYKPILPNAELPPEHLPVEIEKIFNEAAQCFSIGCFNAAGAMFRLCLDITTKNLLNQNTELTPAASDKKTIHSRLHWLFTNNILPINLKDLSRCIKDDGNDAAHDGSLSKEDAADLLDFSYILLERVYTEPARIQNAHQRRLSRRQG